MIKAPLPNYAVCITEMPLSRPAVGQARALRMRSDATELAFPGITSGENGEREDLGPITSVALDPLDGSIWLLVRCAPQYTGLRSCV